MGQIDKQVFFSFFFFILFGPFSFKTSSVSFLKQQIKTFKLIRNNLFMICSIRVQMWGRKWVLSEVPLRPFVSHSVCVPRYRMFTKCKKETQPAHSSRRTLGQARRCMICNLYITVQSRVTARGRLFQISFPACFTKETHTNYNNCAIIST